MRYLFALVILVGGGAAGALEYRHLTAGPAVVLPAPRQLSATMNGTPLLPGGWANSSTLTFRALRPGKLSAGLDVEVQPANVPFTGKPSVTTADPAQVAQNCRPAAGCALPVDTGVARIAVRDGSYHWRVRFHNQDGISPWTKYPGIVRVDTSAPTAPAITSPTDPDPSQTYHTDTVRFAWTDQDIGSGIAGYATRLDTDPKGQAPTELLTQATTDTRKGIQTGTYYFHVRAEDRAGNWGPTATFPVRIDVSPPGLAHHFFNRFQLDPQFEPLTMTFAFTRPTKQIRVGIYRQSDGQQVRLYSEGGSLPGHDITVTWDGKDTGGRLVGSGDYMVYVRAVDPYGHSSLYGWRDFIVDYKRIVVSLSQQKLWAYDGNQIFLTSLVTTGNRALPTPAGTFHIEGKFHPFTFKSPWPKSSPYYYPPSKTEWAMLFREGGYFIHDAPWRSAFGPGTNAQLGTPGNNYTGTHGCVNVPTDVAQKLFAWAEIGTVVQVVR